MKNKISLEEVTGVLQSSITSVSCMFPSIFTKDDVIRLLQQNLEDIENNLSFYEDDEDSPATLQTQPSIHELGSFVPNTNATNDSIEKPFIIDITKKENIKELCTWLREATDTFIENSDFSSIELDIEYETDENYNGLTVTATADTSGLSDKIHSELDFDELEEDFVNAIQTFVDHQSEKAELKNSPTSEK